MFWKKKESGSNSADKHISVCMFGQKHLFTREGGIEIVATEICTRLVQKGFSVTAINRNSRHVAGDGYYDGKGIQGMYEGINILTVPTIDKKGLAALTSSFFASIKASLGPYDIVHIHAEGPSAFCFIPKLFKKKVICHNHGLDHMRPKWGKAASRFIRFGEKMSAKYSDELIVLNESIAGYFKYTYNRDTRIIPNGIKRPLKHEPDIIRKKFGIEKGFILSVSRICPEKNIHGLIEAYRGINTDRKLVIAGGSSDSDEYMEKIRGMAEGNHDIILTGFVQGRCLEELYSNCHVFVQPSDLEGMPMSLLEAMSYGNCCLVSDIPENMDVVGDKAVSFKKGNVEDLKDKLKLLCDNSTLADKYKSGSAEYICDKYNWDDTADEIMKLYKSVV